jgi:hemerythrin-like domain-containing protein
MSEIMNQLKTDHANIDRLLSILQEQMDVIHDEENADFELMHEVMEYMTHYPDNTHHPKEDLVFERLVSRDSGARLVVDRLAKEHRGLAEKGQRLLDSLRHVVDGAMVVRKDLEEQGRDYIEFLRNHMEIEDREAFPLAERTLVEEDWRHVEAGMEARTDPVFGPVVAEDFRSLYQHIERRSDDSVSA